MSSGQIRQYFEWESLTIKCPNSFSPAISSESMPIQPQASRISAIKECVASGLRRSARPRHTIAHASETRVSPTISSEFTNMESTEWIFFETISESRDGYFVRYTPPNAGYRFATANLMFTSPTGVAIAADAMQSEAKYWVAKYPVPVMVSSFDESGMSMDLSSVRPESPNSVQEEGNV